jgi:hypothetical protein
MIRFPFLGLNSVQDKQYRVFGGELLLRLAAPAEDAMSGQRFKQRFAIDHS